MSKLFPVINFKKWIEENRHLLKPPVGNKMVWQDGDFIAMVVGGPNSRKDYHINQTPEFFYQVEGDIVLKVIDEGEHKDIHIREGDIYLLPPGIPHSPRRPANTIGLVIEQKRDEDMKDGLVWHCENCGEKVYEDSFSMKNIEEDLKNVFDDFFSSEEKRKCKNCGTILNKPN
jgi:3-hydroxyanthranilate 3,4-dioxygenase